MKDDHVPKLIPADAVRVWRGFKKKDISTEEFLQKSGSVFVPSGVLTQAKLGLQAYIPSFPIGTKDKPDTLPDETAILFWEDQQTHHDAFKTLAERVYTLTHGALYQMPPSRAVFPLLLADSIKKEQPYYLFDRPADWMCGCVRNLVGGRPKEKTAEDFIAGIYNQVKTLQTSNPEGMDGAIICAGNDYFAYWEHWVEEAAIKGTGIDDLAAMTDVALFKKALPVTLSAELWDQWEGIKVKAGDCFNLQFERRNKS